MPAAGVEAARRKFTPEFMNRLDKIVTFQPLGTEQLKKILDIELNLVQQRIFNTATDRAFVFTLSDTGKDFLLTEGTDMKYGARHLKRAIERLLVQPMSNLIATDQVRGGDWIRVDFDDSARALTFRARSRRSAGRGHGTAGGYVDHHSSHGGSQRRLRRNQPSGQSERTNDKRVIEVLHLPSGQPSGWPFLFVAHALLRAVSRLFSTPRLGPEVPTLHAGVRAPRSYAAHSPRPSSSEYATSSPQS